MSFFNSESKETIHLWIAIFLIVMLTVFRVLSLIPRSSSVCQFVPVLPTVFYIIMSLFVVVLLWVAYKRWYNTILCRTELEFVIKSIEADMLMVVDPQMVITMCNDVVEEILGYKPEEVIGQKTSFLYFDRRITGDKKEIYNRITTIGIHTGFAKGRCKDGSFVPLEVIIGELPNQPGAVILIRDITERKQFEDDLIKAKERAEEASLKLKKIEGMRNSLSDMVVHDLKSPLTAISGYMELIRRAPDNNLKEEYIQFIEEALRLTHKLGYMINSLLDISRLEHHEMPLNKKVFDVKDCCDGVMEVVGPDCKNKNIAIILPSETVLAFGDADIVQRIITNLMSNAIKFSPEGGLVIVRTEMQDSFVKIVVSDTGKGIPEEFHKKIFSKFGQLEVTKFSTGIGLTFCKLAAEAHGGAIGIDSELGKGSEFWFTIPATPREWAI